MLHLLNHYATQEECSFTLSLFFQPEHLHWQSNKQAIGFAWQDYDHAQYQALAYFWLENQQATSPLAASLEVLILIMNFQTNSFLPLLKRYFVG
jgi:hypothetical protein